MDIRSWDMKKVKVAYILISAALAVCAIVAAFLHHEYIALGFIVLASAVVLAGSYLVSYIYRMAKVKDVD